MSNCLLTLIFWIYSMILLAVKLSFDWILDSIILHDVQSPLNCSPVKCLIAFSLVSFFYVILLPASNVEFFVL